MQMAYHTKLHPGAFHTNPYFTRTTFQVKLSEMASHSLGLAQNPMLRILKCLKNDLWPQSGIASRLPYPLSIVLKYQTISPSF